MKDSNILYFEGARCSGEVKVSEPKQTPRAKLKVVKPAPKDGDSDVAKFLIQEAKHIKSEPLKFKPFEILKAA